MEVPDEEVILSPVVASVWTFKRDFLKLWIQPDIAFIGLLIAIEIGQTAKLLDLHETLTYWIQLWTW